MVEVRGQEDIPSLEDIPDLVDITDLEDIIGMALMKSLELAVRRNFQAKF